MDIQERISRCREDAERLKGDIESRKKKLANGTIGSIAVEGKVTLNHSLKARRVLVGHYGKVYSMHWAGDSRQLVSASQDGKLIIWDAFTTNKQEMIPLRTAWVMTCAFDQSSNGMVACGGLDNLCSVYKLDSGNAVKAHRELAGHDGYLSCCRFISSDKIISSSGDSTCFLWDIETATALTSFSDHAADVMSVSPSPSDSNLFVSGSCDTTAKLWDLRSGKCAQTFIGHESDINAVNFLSSGQSFGTGSDDATCRLFDIRSYAQLNEFQGESIVCGITDVDFSKSGRILWGGYEDFHCYGWDVLEEEPVTPRYDLVRHANRVSCVGVSPDGTALCTGSWDTELTVRSFIICFYSLCLFFS